jgi:hypothetical protein
VRIRSPLALLVEPVVFCEWLWRNDDLEWGPVLCCVVGESALHVAAIIVFCYRQPKQKHSYERKCSEKKCSTVESYGYFLMRIYSCRHLFSSFTQCVQQVTPSLSVRGHQVEKTNACLASVGETRRAVTLLVVQILSLWSILFVALKGSGKSVSRGW